MEGRSIISCFLVFYSCCFELRGYREKTIFIHVRKSGNGEVDYGDEWENVIYPRKIGGKKAQDYGGA